MTRSSVRSYSPPTFQRSATSSGYRKINNINPLNCSSYCHAFTFLFFHFLPYEKALVWPAHWTRTPLPSLFQSAAIMFKPISNITKLTTSTLKSCAMAAASTFSSLSNHSSGGDLPSQATIDFWVADTQRGLVSTKSIFYCFFWGKEHGPLIDLSQT